MRRAVRVGIGVLLGGLALPMTAAEPEWNPAAIQECDRSCPVRIMDSYTRSSSTTRNACRRHMDIGEGMLWRSKVEPTGFEIYVADPLAGQVAEQARLLIQGRNALVVVRLRIDCGKILEIESSTTETSTRRRFRY